MMNLITFLLLTFLQLFTGFGILTLSRIPLKRGIFIPLCLLIGVAVFSIIPFLLQLVFIPIASSWVFAALVFVCIMVNGKMTAAISSLRQEWSKTPFRIKLYEIPALLVITGIVLISIWRCFYLPPTPRDLTSGAEAIAEFAVREGSMINSVFSVDVSNNAVKPPFITSLQIIYKLANFPFGQVWLSTIFVSFVIFLYHMLAANVHRIFAGLLIIFLLAIPEMYGYTFMALFDFPNAVFFCCSLFFLFRFFENKKYNEFVFAAMLMGVATYIRSETVVLAGMLLPIIVFNAVKNKTRPAVIVTRCLLFMAPCILLYIISVPLYINFYLPTAYPVSEQVNNDLFNLGPFFKRLSDINAELIFSENGVNYYGWFIFLFLGIFLLDMILMRSMNRQSVNWLYAVMVVYLGLPVLGYLLPLLDLHNSTKRGMLKIFPLMLIYLGNTELLKRLSQRIYKWEKGNQ